MTVKELMEVLAKMEPDMTVVYPDTYERNEGWEDGCEIAVCEIEGYFVNKNGELELQ